MNSNDIIVFDFETLGLNTKIHEPIQLAALAINGRTLKPYSKEEGGVFSSMMRPPGERASWIYEQKALDVNKKTLEQIDAAPSQEAVWTQFVDFVKRYNPRGKPWTAPLPCGHNICNFDLPIIQRLSDKYGTVDKVDGRSTLFNAKCVFDTTQAAFMWFESLSEPENLKMDTLRQYFGLAEKGHDAYVDVMHSAMIATRFLKLHRELAKRIKFKGAMLNDKLFQV
jgi:DNA polymerase III epsilon subunit-like protein